MGEIEVKWSTGVFKADANKVYAEIQKIGEKVTPLEVLDYAKAHEESELHKCFEWNNDIAAEKYRLLMAGNVIRSLYVVPRSAEQPSVRVLSKTSETHTYQPTVKFLSQPDEYADLLRRAKAELESFKVKYKTLTELEDVFTAIDGILF